ncbi:hypothetical protein GTQ99_14800 [Kineococcus sp. T13]|uniref:hypothetical protein n=1 Tax=Kineococcus vitellinus TaxID=2696565 RepID=UPI00141260AE|nr:hypothetical protein [Kineococcus vitellinus]NAZ76678.1 hypothetical protein [Kineococcus vitellinus]
MQRQAALVSLVTVVISAANYGFSLLVVRMLDAAGYVDYASVQSLLLVLGTGCMAAVPWALARHVALHRHEGAGGEALGFGLTAAAVQGALFAVLSLVVVVPASGWGLGGSTALAAFALSLVAAPLGYLQGRQRIGTIAALRLLETVVRLTASVVLLLGVAASPVSPVVGFTAGSTVLVVVGLALCRRAWPLRRAPGATLRALLRQSLLLAVVQIALASVGVVDTVVITRAALGDAGASAYQIAALLGRVPVFLSSAVALAYYQRIAGAPDEASAQAQASSALRQLLLLGLPAAIGVATTPHAVLDLVAPGRGAEVSVLLRVTAVTGLAVGLLTILATVEQARERFRRAARVLVPVAAVQPLLLVVAGRAGGVGAYALTGCALVLVALVLAAVPLRGRWMLASSRGEAALVLVGAALAVASTWQPWLWLVAALHFGVVAARGVLRARTGAVQG